MQPVTPVLPDSKISQANEINIGADQPEYATLPALVFDTHTNPGEMMPVRDFFAGDVVLVRYELDDDDIAELIKTRSLYIAQRHSGTKMHPLLPMVNDPLVRIQDATNYAREQSS